MIKPLPRPSRSTLSVPPAPQTEHDEEMQNADAEVASDVGSNQEVHSSGEEPDILDHDDWPLISQMSVSTDGQWLATSDLQGRTHVFNVDAVKVSISGSSSFIRC